MLVCGPKGSGKSTFSRLLINALLTSAESTSSPTGVVYLDLDPGQPEFSPPGEISLLCLRSFILSPPFTHPTVTRQLDNQIIKAHHIGAITPRDDPLHYMQCIVDLVQCYQQFLHENPSYPLVINCSGWILGCGLEIMIGLLHSMAFTHVVYMSMTGPEEVVRELEQAAQRVQVPFHTLQSQPSQHVTRTAADLRIMQTLSYFHLDGDEETELRWKASPLSFMEPLELHYAGTDQAILGIMVLGQELDLKCLADLVDGSVLGVVAVEDSFALSAQDRRSSQVADGFEVTADIEHSSNSTMNVTSVANHSDYEVRDLLGNQRPSRSVSVYPEVSQAISDPTLNHAWVRRTEEDLPYLFTGIGACIPLDPSKSRSVGQILVRGIDRWKKVLRVSTPIPAETFKRCRESKVQIVLVRGKLDTPTWAYQEECAAALAKGKRRALKRHPRASIEADGQAEKDLDLKNRFDVGVWAKNRPWVRVTHQKKGKHTGDKVWKVRRNLQTREFRSNGARSE